MRSKSGQATGVEFRHVHSILLNRYFLFGPCEGFVSCNLFSNSTAQGAQQYPCTGRLAASLSVLPLSVLPLSN
jgi:hypothetical protein